MIRYEVSSTSFNKIPGYTIAYWVSENFLHNFDIGKRFDSFGEPKSGVMTGDDNKFIRHWFEIEKPKFGMNIFSYIEMVDSGKKWFPVTRGGEYRKWYGNLDEAVNLENDGYAIKNNGKNYRLRDNKYYFKEGLTWTMISSNSLSVRLAEKGILFGNGGPTTFVEDNIYYLLALLNSKISNTFTKVFNPTINTVINDICSIPVIVDQLTEVEKISRDCVKEAKQDWDSFETSWNFKKHPLV